MNFVRETGPRSNGMGFASRTFVSLKSQSSAPEESTNQELEPEPEFVEESQVDTNTDSTEAIALANAALKSLPGERPWCFATVHTDCELLDECVESKRALLLKLTAGTTVLVFAPNEKTDHAQTRFVNPSTGAMTDGYVLASNLTDFRFC